MLRGFEPINIVFFPQTQVVLSFVLFCAALILHRRTRRWPTLLMLLGTVGFVVMHASNAISAYTDYRLATPGSALLRWWSAIDNISGVVTVCFPIGFLAHALRRTSSI